LIERIITRGGPQLPLELRCVLVPSPSRLQERLRQIDHLDVDEARRIEKIPRLPVGTHRSRTQTDGPTMIPLRQSRRREDREERRATSGSEEFPAGSQHGELGGQSTQHIRMDDGVEALVDERKSTGARHHRRRPLADAFGARPSQRGLESLLGQVREHDRTATDLREV
jgi:hypothetical protein